MRELGIKSLPRRRRPKGARVGNVRCADLVRRDFRRAAPDELWMTDITEHPTRAGKIYCGVVIDAFSRRIVGWSVDSTQITVLVTNALGMATRRRDPDVGLVIHAERGVQFTSWAFSQRVRDAGLCALDRRRRLSLRQRGRRGLLGPDAGRALNRKPWKTRIELASAKSTTTSSSSPTPAGATRRSACSPRPSTRTATSKPATPPDSRSQAPRKWG
jgi:putative transposase